MSTRTDLPPDEPIIVMTRIYDAPRALVWEAMTKPEHVRQWWGGPGFTNPVCEIDLRPGGHWNHVLRFPDGKELHMKFEFLEVDAPSRLVWQHVGHGERGGKPQDGPPTSRTTVTLEEVDGGTRCTILARFTSMARREQAVGMGYSRPIEASNDRLADYLPRMGRK
jgi:uncharacterized protein YndB with AHSA1/START domain